MQSYYIVNAFLTTFEKITQGLTQQTSKKWYLVQYRNLKYKQYVPWKDCAERYENTNVQTIQGYSKSLQLYNTAVLV